MAVMVVPAPPRAPSAPPRPFGDLSTMSIDDIATLTAEKCNTGRNGRAVNKSGMKWLLDLLAEHPGMSWQQRWEAAGLNDPGHSIAGLTGDDAKRRKLVTTAAGHAFCMRLIQPSLVAFRATPSPCYVPKFRRAVGDPLLEAVSAGVPFGWVAGDEVYGRSSKLRAACEDTGKGYVLAVPVNHQVTTSAGRKATVAALARLVPARCWETRSCGRGCKGHRDYEWALVATSSPRHWLLIRRKICDPADLAFFCCHAPGMVSLSILIKVAGKRWPVVM
jgi:hypothetical protein